MHGQQNKKSSDFITAFLLNLPQKTTVGILTQPYRALNSLLWVEVKRLCHKLYKNVEGSFNVQLYSDVCFY
jgi:hypothetical protein